MSIRLVRILFITWIVSLHSACAASDQRQILFQLNQSTTEITGWLFFNGYEPALFQTDNFNDYAPFDLNENDKCISIVIDHSENFSDYEKLTGELVTVTGFVVKYDDLQDGDSVHDQLLAKKYYSGQLVENYCYRNFIFVATDIHMN